MRVTPAVVMGAVRISDVVGIEVVPAVIGHPFEKRSLDRHPPGLGNAAIAVATFRTSAFC